MGAPIYPPEHTVKQSCIVIPVYNNPDTIQEVVRDALETGAYVIVVDDGSEPSVTFEEASDSLELLRHSRNKGKGEAIISGGSRARALGFDAFFVVDADGQHFPSEISRFEDKQRDKCIVIGNRRFEENVPGSSQFGRKFSNFWVRLETGRSLDDTQSGFRSYPVSILDLPLHKKRYDFEIEVLVQHLWAGGCVEEVEISVYYPKPEERISHFDKFRDNVRLSLLHSSLVLRRWWRLVLRK
jgi:glycosyltransferase involved in cell wall biosynthesis